ncbi:MAG: hypothetical protein OJF49_001955 [Ktedonobacterales bacterium]|nr:MAG: hypothetical protein OJF49_001955 [Ktedonobacterales bacterium]
MRRLCAGGKDARWWERLTVLLRLLDECFEYRLPFARGFFDSSAVGNRLIYALLPLWQQHDIRLIFFRSFDDDGVVTRVHSCCPWYHDSPTLHRVF